MFSIGSTLDWLKNSPDLNLTENLWEIAKRIFDKKQPSSSEALREDIEEVWTKEISACACCVQTVNKS